MVPSTVLLSATLGALDGDPRRSLERLASMGLRRVQLSATQPGLRPRELDATARRGVQVRLRQLALAASGIDCWIPGPHLLDPASVDRAVEAILAAVELAADLGRVPVCVTLPAPPDREPERLDEVLATILDHADRHGVDVVDHAVDPTSHVGGHAHRLLTGLDPAAWLAVGRDPVEAAFAVGSRLGAVRLVDLTRSGMRAPVADARCGAAAQDAQLDPQRYAVALSIAAPALPVTIDARQWADPWAGIEQSVTVWERARSQ